MHCSPSLISGTKPASSFVAHPIPARRTCRISAVGDRPLWQHVAEKVQAEWNAKGNCMMVASAINPAEMAVIRAIAGDMTLLVPGHRRARRRRRGCRATPAAAASDAVSSSTRRGASSSPRIRPQRLPTSATQLMPTGHNKLQPVSNSSQHYSPLMAPKSGRAIMRGERHC